MTTSAQPIAAHGFVAEPPITVIVTPNLKAEESARLLECINKVRSGEKVYFVRLTNHKVTEGHKRLPPQDYVADPALRPHAHEGLLVDCKINRKGKPYLRLHDEARRPAEGRDFGFTNISMDGIESFKVLGERPGPLAHRRPEPAAQAPNLQATALAMQAQGLFMMGQAMVQMGQAMMGQPQPQGFPPFPVPAVTPASQPQVGAAP